MNNWKFLILWIIENWQIIIALIILFFAIRRIELLKNREKELFFEMMEREREWNRLVKKINHLYDKQIFKDEIIEAKDIKEINNIVIKTEKKREDRVSIENYDFIFDLQQRIDEFKNEYPNFFKN
jgi:predicted tellurium resistance membrane protein TerC